MNIICNINTLVSTESFSDVRMVILPAHDGEMGVLYGHMNLIAEVVHGKMRIYKSDNTNGGDNIILVSIDNGIVHITSSVVNIFCNKYQLI
jgi:F0F1-type ATP synthase epsilon subunit